MSDSPSCRAPQVVRDHRRQWRTCKYVYPVISRRSRGVSIGVNLNPDKRCTFACLYCQINRSIRRRPYEIELPLLREELDLALTEAVAGNLWKEDRFRNTPADMRHINDIAFSGDGEPTCLTNFDECVAAAADAKRKMGLEDVKIVVITNATQTDTPQFCRALPILDANHGEIWAKLDAGTEEYCQRMNRPHPRVSLGRIVEGLTGVALGRPIVIQSLFCLLDGQPPQPDEIDAYCGRIRQIIEAGGKIKLIQAHTIARSPASASVATLPNAELDNIAATIRAALDDVPVETYYGQDVEPQEK